MEYFDFLSDLPIGVTIDSATVTVAVVSGTDASPSSLKYGSPSISGAKVGQMFTGGVTGVIYSALCAATCSDSQILQQSGYLAVIGDV